MGVPFEEAERLKQATFLPQHPSAANQELSARIVESAVTSWIEEIRGSLDYYLAQSGAARIERIVLSGGGGQLGGLAAQLSAATRLPVEAANPFAGLRLGRTGLSSEQLAYVEPFCAVPVGLALAAAS
jgi:type IV pilus assembly protein PilM